MSSRNLDYECEGKEKMSWRSQEHEYNKHQKRFNILQTSSFSQAIGDQ